jgi:hypothetical protein
MFFPFENYWTVSQQSLKMKEGGSLLMGFVQCVMSDTLGDSTDVGSGWCSKDVRGLDHCDLFENKALRAANLDD